MFSKKFLNKVNWKKFIIVISIIIFVMVINVFDSEPVINIWFAIFFTLFSAFVLLSNAYIQYRIYYKVKLNNNEIRLKKLKKLNRKNIWQIYQKH